MEWKSASTGDLTPTELEKLLCQIKCGEDRLCGVKCEVLDLFRRLEELHGEWPRGWWESSNYEPWDPDMLGLDPEEHP